MVVSLPVRSPVQSPVRSTLGRVSATFLDEMLAYGAIDAWDFTSGAYLRGGTYTNNPGLTVTRASEGYAETADGRLLKFGSGVLRRTDKGVLVEGARTNIATYSDDLSTDWSDASAGTTTRTPNYGIAPNGTQTASRLQGNNANTWWFNGYKTAAWASTSATFSVYLRSLSGTPTISLRLFFNGGGQYTQAITLTENWARYSFSQLFGAGDTQALGFAINHGNGNDILAWGAQLEAASFVSSYIPTEASTVTRAADVVTAVPTSGTDYPLSLFAEGLMSANSVNGGLLLANASGSFSELYVDSSLRTGVSTTGGGFKLATGFVSANAIFKAAGRVATNDINIARDGVAASPDTTATNPNTPTKLQFGFEPGGGAYLWSYVRRAAIFPSALSDAELEAITS